MNCKTVIGFVLLYIFLSHFYPIQGYEFLDANTRCNKATGTIETRGNQPYSSGWSKR